MSKTYFNPLWVKDYPWVKKVESDNSRCFCTVCSKSFSLSTMGVGAVRSHALSEKHKKLCQGSSLTITSMFGARVSNKPILASSSSAPTAASSSKTCGDQVDFDQKDSFKTVAREKQYRSSFDEASHVVKAEILLVLKTVTAHHSFKSLEDSSQLFTSMFPDSAIAKRLSCAETKSRYMCSFGLGPFFKQQLLSKIKEEDHFVVVFDESLNKDLQKKQLDVHVRYWNGDIVVTQYLTSVFLGHAKATDLMDSMESALKDLDIRKVIQISMDGPAVNKKFFADLTKTLESQHDNDKKMLNIGTCGLHIIHNAFRAGHDISSCNWKLDRFFDSLFYLFSDSPARRDDFIQITSTSTFALKFCKHRWVENSAVAERALAVWPNFKHYIETMKERKKEPNIKSFESLLEMKKDKLLEVKVQIFHSIAKDLEPFLKKFQTDQPMLPFICESLQRMISSLLRRVLQTHVLASKSINDLVRLDLKDQTLYCDVAHIDIGYAANKKLKELIKAGLPQRQAFNIRMETRAFILKSVGHMVEKLPCKYSVCRAISCLDPRNLVRDEADMKSKFQLLLKELETSHWISESECDDILRDFSLLREEVAGSEVLKALCEEFCPGKDRLDLFYKDRCRELEHLWKVVKLTLPLSHGQATVERGFSYNKEATVTNISEECLVAKRVIIDQVRSAGGIFNITITPKMMSYVSSSRAKYHAFLEEKAKSEERKSLKRQRDEIMFEVDGLKRKKVRLQNEEKDLRNKSEELADKAEENPQSSLIAQSNALRRAAREKAEMAKAVEEELQSKLMLLKN